MGENINQNQSPLLRSFATEAGGTVLSRLKADPGKIANEAQVKLICMRGPKL